MEHKGTKMLESDRLLLRRFRMEDAKAMFENWASNPEVTEYLMWKCHENVGTSEDVLSDWIPRYQEDGYYLWAIVLKDNGDAPIGSIAAVRKDDMIKMVHIGYALGRKWWRQGITSEALGLLVRFFFEEVGVNRVESRHDPRNPNSGKVMEKCGLVYEGTLREADWNNQGICDAAMYALLAKDYFAAKQAG